MGGFNLRGVFQTLLAYIGTRRDATYQCLAMAYYREVLVQIDTFMGPPDAASPLMAAEWIADRESELWYMFYNFGLEAVDTDPADLSDAISHDSSGSGSCDSVTGDESSLMERPDIPAYGDGG